MQLTTVIILDLTEQFLLNDLFFYFTTTPAAEQP